MARENILIVEDEELMRAILRSLVEREGYNVFTADSAETAIEIFAANDIAATLTDIKMSGRDGIELLDELRSINAEAIVIIMTAYSSVETAVAALRNGAYDYITKPFVNEYLLLALKNAVSHRNLVRENRVLRREVGRRVGFDEMVGRSDAVRGVFDLVRKVADTSANVLIEGESGTGKELIARALHFNSVRHELPFLAVNCGALPESLLESEMFGYVRGAFTGAVGDKLGLFRSVAGGTLFLDEIGEMPVALQVKLLRALQEHEVTPVGSPQAVGFDARIVAATNKNLEIELAEGRFREDLYYRLNVVEIRVPPLRERRDDIPLLVRHFASRVAMQQKLEDKPVSASAMSALAGYDWPGNIRELENVIERAIILGGDEIDLESLPAKIVAGNSIISPDDRTLDDVERRHIAEVMQSVGGDKVRAAEVLGIDLSTLYRKLKRNYLPVTSTTK